MALVWTLILVAAGLIVCLVLFVLVKIEVQALARRAESRFKALEAGLSRLQEAVEELRIGLKEADERTGVLAPPSPPRSGLNLTTRAQALRMLRRGETPERIAAALHVPEQEVRLLIKVHQLTTAAGG
jgi:DNA-binding NarL/FixJ family response regulator